MHPLESSRCLQAVALEAGNARVPPPVITESSQRQSPVHHEPCSGVAVVPCRTVVPWRTDDRRGRVLDEAEGAGVDVRVAPLGSSPGPAGPQGRPWLWAWAMQPVRP